MNSAGAGAIAFVVRFLRTIHGRDYLAAKAADFGTFSKLTILMSSIAVISFILWDYAVDSANAAQAIRWRLLESGALLLWAILIWRGVASRTARVISFVAPLVILGSYIKILSILDNGAIYGTGGFMYFFIFLPFIMFAQPAGYAIFILLTVAMFAPIAAVFGLTAGFDWTIYHAFVWLGFFPVAFIILLMDYLYWNLLSYREQATAQATTDSLTHITNRRHFLALAAQRLARHAEQRSPVSLLFIDIDRFKTINDRYGHAVGDAAIRHVVQTMAALIRHQDVFARYGGEEFVALLSQTDEARAVATAERMRVAVARSPFYSDLYGEDPIELAISIGITTYMPSATSTPDIDVLIHEADIALYHAKNGGRNRVVVHERGHGSAERRSSSPLAQRESFLQ